MKKIKKNESGRSMVEMLGVLAIIGVLSVGGIAGYRMAMGQHRANEIVNHLERFFVGKQKPSKNYREKAEFEGHPFNFHVADYESDASVTLTIDDYDMDVYTCKALFNMMSLDVMINMTDHLQLAHYDDPALSFYIEGPSKDGRYNNLGINDGDQCDKLAFPGKFDMQIGVTSYNWDYGM